MRLTQPNSLLHIKEQCLVVGSMIKSFKHKGLERSFSKGSTAAIQPSHATKVSDRLAFLHAAACIEDMNKPSYRLHPLKGKLKDHWAINVSGNWHIAFKFEEDDAYIVNYEDYH